MSHIDLHTAPPEPGHCTRRSAVSLMVSLACASLAVAVHAQSGTAADPPATPAELRSPEPQTQDTETVTVTATRRREPAREVPMQVNSLSTRALEASGAKSLADYLGSVPGVDVKTAGGAALGSINVRGVSTGDQAIATVGTYIDEVAVGSSNAFLLGGATALDMALLDLNHIELLRGPQGTLYGAGAMGGLLKYVTNEPDTYLLSGKVSFGGSRSNGGSAGNTVSAVVNLPLREDVAGLRVSAFSDRAGGFIDAVGAAAGTHINGGRTTGARASLLVEPQGGFKIRLTATTQDLQRDGRDYVDYDPATGRPVEGDTTRRLTLAEPYQMKIDVAAADLEYDFGWAHLNSITSHQRSRLTQRIDYSGVYGPLLAGSGIDVETVPLDLSARVRKTTQEFRLTSKAGGTIEWLAGAFYDRESGVNPQHVSSTVAGGGAGPDLATANLPSTYTETALYGDLTWHATPQLALTGGVRVARNKQTYTQQSDGPLVGGPTLLDGSSGETSKTYLATARYALDRTSNVYLRAASGYRPGGPNAVLKDPVTGVPVAPPTFKHDSLWSYEAGYKADLLDKTLAVEAAVYDIRWTQLQQFVAVNGVQILTNAGKAHIQGAELATQYRPASSWNLAASLAYIDARLSEDAPGLAASGSRLPNSARFSANLSAKYLFSLANKPSSIGVAQRHVGERNAGYDGSGTAPNYKLPSYALTDLQAEIDFGRVQLALYLRNAFDKRAQLSASTSFVPLGGPVLVTPATPRTLGATVSVSF